MRTASPSSRVRLALLLVLGGGRITADPLVRPELSSLQVRTSSGTELPLRPAGPWKTDNASAAAVAFNRSIFDWTCTLPQGQNATGHGEAVRLYAHHALSGEGAAKNPELRVIAYSKPGMEEHGLDFNDQRTALEKPFCLGAHPEADCDGSTDPGGLLEFLNRAVNPAKFEIVACPPDESESTCEDDGATYTVYVRFPEGGTPGPSPPDISDPSWTWVYGIVLCEISAFLYACGICIQRYSLRLKETAGRSSVTSRSSVSDILGPGAQELQPASVGAHMVTAPPGSAPGKHVSVVVNGKSMSVEVPAGVRAGDQFSVPIVSDGAGGTKEPFHVRRRLDLIWFGGMSMWFIGNSVYTFGLSYAPLALLTSLFATVLIFNGVLAAVFLKEEVKRADIVGWVLIFIGITICGFFIDKTVQIYSADEIFGLAHEFVAVLYLVIVFVLLIGITAGILLWERNNPAVPAGGAYPIGLKLGYPGALALCESLIQILLKGLSNMVSLTFKHDGENQFENWRFWVIFGLCGFFSLGVMIWMRMGYSRFEAVAMLPIQMATLQAATVVGSIMFYQEYKRMSVIDLFMTAVGVLFITGGIVAINNYRELLEGGPRMPAPRGFAQRSSTPRSELGANLLTGGDSRSAAVGDWDIETVGDRETPRLAGGL